MSEEYFMMPCFETRQISVILEANVFDRLGLGTTRCPADSERPCGRLSSFGEVRVGHKTHVFRLNGESYRQHTAKARAQAKRKRRRGPQRLSRAAHSPQLGASSQGMRYASR